MILHGILAYRSSITCYVSIITILLQHFTILLILHLLIYALSHTIPILHSPTVLTKWANSPSTIYNTMWTFQYYLFNTRASSITDIALSNALHSISTPSIYTYPIPFFHFWPPIPLSCLQSLIWNDLAWNTSITVLNHLLRLHYHTLSPTLHYSISKPSVYIYSIPYHHYLSLSSCPLEMGF